MGSLATRYRPKNLDEVAAQEGSVEVLRKMVQLGQIPSALVFYGLHGTGKTTLARIMAKAVNCQYPKREPLPCGKCNSCLSDSWDCLVEIDAASHRGIQQMLDLLKEVGVRGSSNYKVYIIDEVHMLTPEAMSAFLKTLEEPPPGTLFLLATTAYDKLLPTIRSRCVPFEMRPFPVPKIVKRLQYVCDQEGIPYSKEGLVKVAGKSDRSMRNALMVLESVKSSSAKVTGLAVRKFFGGLLEKEVFRLCQFLLDPDNTKFKQFFKYRLELLETSSLAEDTLVTEVCYFLRDAALAAVSPVLVINHPYARDERIQKLLGPHSGFAPAMLDSLRHGMSGTQSVDFDILWLSFRDRIINPDKYIQKEMVYREVIETKKKREPAPAVVGVSLGQFVAKMGFVLEQGEGRTTIKSRGGKLLDIVTDVGAVKNEFYILLSDLKQLKLQQVQGAWLQQNGMIHTKEAVSANKV